MEPRQPAQSLALALLVLTPVVLPLPTPAAEATSGGWALPGSLGMEPNHPVDHSRVMFPDPNRGPVDRLYLDGIFLEHKLTPGINLAPFADTAPFQRPPGTVLQPYAYLGFWRDCNLDGTIGNSLSATLTYPTSWGYDEGVCPEGSPYQPGHGRVYEFQWVGPQATRRTGSYTLPGMVDDPGARVWADLGSPGDEAPARGVYAYPLPRGTLESPGGLLRWANELTFGRLGGAAEALILGQAGLEWSDAEEQADWLGDHSGTSFVMRRTGGLYNDSRHDHEEGTPFVDAWDCERSSAIPFTHYALPSVNVRLDADGSVMPTVDRLTRPTPSPGDVARNPLGDPHDSDPCGDSAEDAALTQPYQNLEGDRAGENEPGHKKDRSDFTFAFQAAALPDGNILGLRDPEELWGYSTTEIPYLYEAPSPHPICTLTCTGWFSQDVLYVPPGEHARNLLEALEITFYSTVDDALISMGTNAQQALPSGKQWVGMYGAEHCNDGFGPSSSEDTWWNCDPADWSERNQGCLRTCVEVGASYSLRDVDRMTAPLTEARALLEPDRDGDGLGDGWEERNFGPEHDFLQLVDDQDCDGLTTLDEFRWNLTPLDTNPPGLCPPAPTDPLGLFENGTDYDGDRWLDGPEVAYWNDPSNDPTTGNFQSNPSGVAPLDPDAHDDEDGDGHPNVHDPDSDNDGILDGIEWLNGTYPEHWDSDCREMHGPCAPPPANRYDANPGDGRPGWGDGLPDGAERAYWDLVGPEAWQRDYDADLTANNLLDRDADGDELPDGEELGIDNGHFAGCGDGCTLPEAWDTDGDGLLDGLDLVLEDGDPRARIFRAAGVASERVAGQGTRFYGERTARTDPLDWDSDGDCLPDAWEVKYGLDPLGAQTTSDDRDRDGASDLEEYRYHRPGSHEACSLPVWWGGTRPDRGDTDLDGLPDGREIHRVGTDALEPDTDLDGLLDGAEVDTHKTSPLRADTDGEGLTDYQEVITYAVNAPDPRAVNTDNRRGDPANDTLNDYSELVQHHTNVTNWDTDLDGIPDGWDRRAHTRDEQPRQVPLSSAVPVPGAGDAYVIFREKGYVDVLVRDAHDDEVDVAAVEVRAKLTGQLTDGTTDTVTVYHEAERFDDGSTWGTRIAMPDRMRASTSQGFSLVIVTDDGNVATYTGSVENFMRQVPWASERDPAEGTALGNEWARLQSHDSETQPPEAAAAQTAPAGTMPAPTPPVGGAHDALLDGGTPATPDLAETGRAPAPNPYAMNLDTLFAAYGNFTVYRLKPYALPANTTIRPGANTSLLATLEEAPLNSALDLNTSHAPALDFTLYHNAFERVDPTRELGVYQTFASGGNSWFRSARTLWSGVARPWMDVVKAEGEAQLASFVFGADDPRAKGRLTGDIIAGILVVGDVRDVVIGVANRDQMKVLLGGIGIGLTWVGPQADGPWSAFKAGLKQLRAVNPKVAWMIFTNFQDAFRAARANSDPGMAIRALHAASMVTWWGLWNPDKLDDLERLMNSVEPYYIRELATRLDNVVALSADAFRIWRDEDAARTMLTDMTEKSAMFPIPGPHDFAEIADYAAVIRRASGPVTSSEFLRDLHGLRDAEDANFLWTVVRTDIHQYEDFWLKYPFAVKVAARLKAAHQLGGLALEIPEVKGRGGEVDLFVLALQKTGEGPHAIVDMRPAPVVDATPRHKNRLEVQVAAINQQGTTHDLARQIHWYFQGRPSEALRDYAKFVEENENVRIRFYDENREEITL